MVVAPQRESATVAIDIGASCLYFCSLLFVSSIFFVPLVDWETVGLSKSPSPFWWCRLCVSRILDALFWWSLQGLNVTVLFHSFLLSLVLLAINRLLSPSQTLVQNFSITRSKFLSILFLPLRLGYFLFWLAFSAPAAVLPLFSMVRPCGLTVVWHSVRVIGLSMMMCKENLSSSKQ